MADKKRPKYGYLFKNDDSNTLDMDNPVELEGVEERLNPLDLENLVVIDPETGHKTRPWRFCSSNPTIISEDGGRNVRIRF